MLNTNGQDMFYSDFRVYLEGVQIPFESAHISNTYKGTPRASITLPPWPGMQEVGKNYHPKVYILWRDYNFGVSKSEAVATPDADQLRKAKRDAYKVIFSGIVTGISDSKEISPSGGGQSLTLQCEHHSEVLSDILLRFANQQITAAQSQIDVQSEGSQQLSEWDLNFLMIKALMGVANIQDESSIQHIPKGKWDELKGTPGVLKVLWNIIKKETECLKNVRKILIVRFNM